MAIKDWSTTPANNNFSVLSGGCPENWAPSQVNNVLRIQMANHKTQWLDAEWFDHGDSGLSRASNTSFKITGDVTAEYLAGRRVKCNDATTLYGVVSSSSYLAPDTTVNVTMDSGTLSTSLTAVALGILKPTNIAIPALSGLPSLGVGGASSLSGAVVMKTTLNVEGATTLSGNAVAKGTFLVEGATTLVGAATLKGITTLEAAVVCKTTLNVEGNTSLSGNAVLKGTLNVEGATTLSGAATLKGITTLEAATTLKSTLNVEGATTLSGAVVMKGSLDVTGPIVSIKANASQPAYLRMYEDTDNGTNYLEIQAPSAIASNRTYTLPDLSLNFTPVYFKATRSATQSINDNSATKVQYDTEALDSGGYYDNATNYRFTPLQAGYYLFIHSIEFASPQDQNLVSALIYKNGGSVADRPSHASGTSTVGSVALVVLLMNGSTDYVEAYGYQDNAGNTAKNVLNGTDRSSFEGYLIHPTTS